MKKVLLCVFGLVMLFTLSIRPVFADSPQITSEDATKILKALNPHIVSYDVNTDIVTYDNYKPVFVTPPGCYPRNGEVTWDYFVQQKGDLRGWLKMSPKEIAASKSRIITESGLKSSNIIKPDLANSGFASATQYPQYGCTWCGVAATESVLSCWGITSHSQSEIAYKEYGYNGIKVPAQCDCLGAGVSEDSIAYALNGYVFNRWTSSFWFKISHFSSQQDFINIIGVDVGADQVGVVFCGYTEHLPAWNRHHAVHYTVVYGYNLSNSIVAYTDSANGLYIYCSIASSSDQNGNIVHYDKLPGYNTCHINASPNDSYYQYAYPYPAVG